MEASIIDRQRRLVAAVVAVGLEEAPQVILALIEAVEVAHSREGSRSAVARQPGPHSRRLSDNSACSSGRGSELAPDLIRG
jgi:hypothetical protein